MNASKPDILIFMSDQHNAMVMGCAGDEIIRTPNLDRLATEGTCFDAAYTACPLCVPSRLAFLTGQMTSRTMTYDNKNAIAADQATIMHALGAAGYETILCGRMHFRGYDQRCGFSKRIIGDILPGHVGSKGSLELGPLASTLGMKGCTSFAGKGNSPILDYDKMVVDAALEYLSQQHEKPQCIVVGTYGPHCSYVAPPELFDYYREQVALPESEQKDCNFTGILDSIELYNRKELDSEKILDIRAAYYGMVEYQDMLVGQVKKAWDKYLQDSDRKGVFSYLSDHGDQIGEKRLYTKCTMFEGATRIPLIIAGDNIKNNHRVKSPVSIMDLTPTFCEMTDAPPIPVQDGVSLIPELSEAKENPERAIFSEFMSHLSGHNCMIRHGKWKLITHSKKPDSDILIDLENDPDELTNIITEFPEEAAKLMSHILSKWDSEKLEKEAEIIRKNIDIIAQWGKETQPENTDQVRLPTYKINNGIVTRTTIKAIK